MYHSSQSHTQSISEQRFSKGLDLINKDRFINTNATPRTIIVNKVVFISINITLSSQNANYLYIGFVIRIKVLLIP